MNVKKRDVAYPANEVTLTIFNTSQQLADGIERNLCLFIDTDTVKKSRKTRFC